MKPDPRALLEGLLALDDPPTAVLTSSDTVAFRVQEMLRAVGFDVPRDISVVGFDDIPLSGVEYRQLTTVHQPLYELGAAAARMLLARINDQSLARRAHSITNASRGAWLNPLFGVQKLSKVVALDHESMSRSGLFSGQVKKPRILTSSMPPKSSAGRRGRDLDPDAVRVRAARSGMPWCFRKCSAMLTARWTTSARFHYRARSSRQKFGTLSMWDWEISVPAFRRQRDDCAVQPRPDAQNLPRIAKSNASCRTQVRRVSGQPRRGHAGPDLQAVLLVGRRMHPAHSREVRAHR